MKLSEILRLVFINLIQNKFKVILTSIGIVVGAATIVMVIAIGRGGQMAVAEQFRNLNAGAIDISYTMANNRAALTQGQGQNTVNLPGGGQGFFQIPAGSNTASSAQAGGSNQQQGGNAAFPQGFDPRQFAGFLPGGANTADNRVNFERITLSESDVEDIEVFVPDIASVSISFTTRSPVEGGDLEAATTYTIAGVKPSYARMSNLQMAAGEFITESNDESAAKICILGASVAKEIFGSATDAYDSVIYIDNRPYVVNGVLQAMGTVASGISPDTAVFLPFNTGKKYIAGINISPTITVIAADVNNVGNVITNLKQVLAQSYPNATFTIADAGSKMDAAAASNRTLTLLLFAMAAIVFIVGGIGIMNVLFVSVKERTKEIGILKSIGCRKRDILLEFLFEASFISILGGVLGVALSILITPIIEMLKVRVELSMIGGILAVGFAIITGTAFGFYPALKASRLIPVLALAEI